jgi:hypothetical protein
MGGFGRLAARDGGIVALALGATAFALHEWGHVLGSFAGRSRMRASASLASHFVFSFSPKNSLAQFLAMSFAGFAATAAVLWVFYTPLPDAWLASRVARGAALFLAFLGVTLELPLVGVALYRGATPGVAAVKVPRRADPPAA